ncbi:MAG: hypothetical protein AABN95_04350 [Acidobacteriota bacterium]
MALSNHDPETIRRYLLGQLTDDEQSTIEQRLLTEDEFFEEMEVTKDELVEDYLAKQLTKEEAGWFEQNFLVSPEGKQRQGFAKALNRYVIDHRLPAQQKLTLAQRFVAFWNSQPGLLRAAGAMAIVVIVVGIFWFSRVPSPKSFATLTLQNSPSTRSAGIESSKVKLREDVLTLTLSLPAPATPGVSYRIELMNDKGETKTYEVPGPNAQSVSVEIPAAHLPRGQYAITMSAIRANGTVQRIPGSYYFTIE